MSQPASRSRRANATASSPSKPPSTQSVALIRTDIGFSAGHTSRQAAKTSSGNFAAVAPVLVVAHVGQRRQERRQQVAVRHVDLEQVEARGVGPPRGGDEVARAPRPCPRGSSRAAPGSRPARYGSGDGAISGQLPSWQRLVLALPQQLRRALAPRVPDLAPIAARECVCTKSTIRFHAAVCSSRVEPAAAGRDPPVGATCRSSRSSPARRRRSPARRGARGGSRPACRRPSEYMSIGETTTRLASSSPRSRNGVNIGGALGQPRRRTPGRASAARRR